MSNEAILRGYVLLLARAHAKARKVKLTTVSRLAHGDRTFFGSLADQDKRDRRRTTRSGRQASMTLRKMDEVIDWFMNPANWPGGTIPALPQLSVTVNSQESNGQCPETEPLSESTSTMRPSPC